MIIEDLASTLGAANPFRYKGYYYDSETGLYYLNSRYYNPEWGRFISADSILGQTGGLLSHNLFAYCRNNPVMYSDSSGAVIDTILDIIFCIVDVVAVIIDPSVENQIALAADAACLAIPFATGGGLVARGVSAANKAIDAYNAVDNTLDAYNAIDNGIDAGKTIDNVTEPLRRTGDQQALADLAQDSVRRNKAGNPISFDDAKILDRWANEYNVPFHHQSDYYFNSPHWEGPHTHIYNFHVPFWY